MPKEPAELKTSGYWRFFIGLPLIFGAIASFLLPLALRTESPQYLMSRNKDE